MFSQKKNDESVTAKTAAAVLYLKHRFSSFFVAEKHILSAF